MTPAIEPVPPGDAIRARVPAVLDVWTQTRVTVLEDGVVDRDLKALCARYLAGDEEVISHAEDPGRFDDRQRAALQWTFAIAYDSTRADAELWERLHRCFTEPELVELGYAIALTLGQQHWLMTLGLTPDGEREAR